MYDKVYMSKGNLLPALKRTLFDANGPIDLTTAVSVKFNMRDVNLDTMKITAATATVVTPASGIVQYVWAGTDTNTIGSYVAWFDVEHTTGKVASYPDTLQRILVVVNDGRFVG